MESLESVAKSMRELAEATLSEHHSTGALASAAGGSVDLPELKPMEHNMGKTMSGPDIMNIVRARVYGAETGKAARPAVPMGRVLTESQGPAGRPEFQARQYLEDAEDATVTSVALGGKPTMADAIEHSGSKASMKHKGLLGTMRDELSDLVPGTSGSSGSN